jgi:predicted flap endonuclease-1-like 5' DNA nuclease
MLLSIVAALLVGLLAGWLIWGRILVSRRSAAGAAPATAVAAPVETAVAAPETTPASTDSTDSTVEPVAEPVAAIVEASPAETPETNAEPVAAETEPVARPEPVVTAATTSDTEPVTHPEPVVTAASDTSAAGSTAAETPDTAPVTEPVAVTEPFADAEPAAVASPFADAEPAAGTIADTESAGPIADAEPTAGPFADTEPAAVVVPETGSVPVRTGAAATGDKLTRIEGIGPKIAATLAAAGITTYRELADTDLATLRTTIKAAKLRLSPNLATWPAQARLLAEGDQRGFAALADDLAADREPGVEPITTDPAPSLASTDTAALAEPASSVDTTPAAAEPVTLAEPASSVDTTPAAAEPVTVAETAGSDGVPAQRAPEATAPAVPDDLTRVEGIGPKMAAALIASGITTYAQLAGTDEATLRAAISAAGMRFSPSLVTWPQQAKLLADRGAVRN